MLCVGMGTGSLWLTNSPQSGCQDLPSSRLALCPQVGRAVSLNPMYPHTSLLKLLPQRPRTAPTYVPCFALFPVPHPCRHRNGLQAENICALCPPPSSSTSSIEYRWGLGYSPALSFPSSFQPIPWVLHSPYGVLWPVTLTASCLHGYTDGHERFAWNRKNSLREPSPAVLQSVLH